MSQTIEGAKKAKDTILKKYGVTSEGKSKMHVRAGALGGKAHRLGGFVDKPDLASKMGGKGGKLSRRGYKLVKKTDTELHYVNKITGEPKVIKRADV